MQAYYETETEVSENRQVTVQLPDNVPPGRVKVVVAYEVTGEDAGHIVTRDDKAQGMAEFLANLPINYEGGMSTQEIRAFIDKERQSWDD